MKQQVLALAMIVPMLGGVRAQSDSTKAAVEIVPLEIPPQFPGGEQALYAFIRDAVKYPREAVDNGITGRVYVGFVIRKDGVVDSVHTVRGVHPLLDAEAERVIGALPDWQPGMMNGKPVVVRYNMPITFSLSEPAKKKKGKKKREGG